MKITAKKSADVPRAVILSLNPFHSDRNSFFSSHRQDKEWLIVMQQGHLACHPVVNLPNLYFGLQYSWGTWLVWWRSGGFPNLLLQVTFLAVGKHDQCYGCWSVFASGTRLRVKNIAMGNWGWPLAIGSHAEGHMQCRCYSQTADISSVWCSSTSYLLLPTWQWQHG